jgi:hypothetical protein
VTTTASELTGRQETIVRYDRYRSVAYGLVLARTAGLSGLRLERIDGAALDFWEKHWKPNWTRKKDYGEWDWRLADDTFQRDRRFEVAIWRDDLLCGLAVGGKPVRNQYARVDFMEGWPGAAHPLKGRILPLTAAVAAAYGLQVDAKRILFLNPYEALIPRYEKEKFHLVPATPFLPRCCERIIVPL